MSETIQTAVIGAGVVGLAIARALAMSGREVILLESQDAIGTGTSARNSEVIHAGIYYPPGSLKAELCVKGKEMLYRYCKDHGVDHKRTGKLIVATDESQHEALATLFGRAQKNGVTDLQKLSGADARKLEPDIRCTSALLSPSTGIVDSHGLMLSLQGDAEEHGAMIAFLSPVESGRLTDDGILLEVGGENPMPLLCKEVVNTAGLGAVRLALSLKGLDESHVPPFYMAKGNYFSLSGKTPFRRLIYPAPEQAGLGVHLTLDLGGQARFGPDVQWVESEDYEVDPRRGDSFYAAIRKYWPDLKDGSLQPAYSGIRPKIQAPGQAAADFVIQGPKTHGVKGLVNLFGIESPGLTSCLAIAEAVVGAFKSP